MCHVWVVESWKVVISGKLSNWVKWLSPYCVMMKTKEKSIWIIGFCGNVLVHVVVSSFFPQLIQQPHIVIHLSKTSPLNGTSNHDSHCNNDSGINQFIVSCSLVHEDCWVALFSIHFFLDSNLSLSIFSFYSRSVNEICVVWLFCV